jgi:hypothetical protein
LITTDVIGEVFSQRRLVRKDNLGSFQITLQGTPAETEEELGKANIKNAKIIYKPSRIMKVRLKQLTYKRLR